MVKPILGSKRRCADCGAPFYDLGKQPIVCPKCGVEFRPEVVTKSRRPRPEEKPAPRPVPVVAEEIEEASEEKVPRDGDLIEDVTELGEDKDDMAEVLDEGETPEER